MPGKHLASAKHRMLIIAALGALIAPLNLLQLGAQAAEVKILSLPGLRGVFHELVPKFEGASGHKLAITYDVNAPLLRQIDVGDKFDIVILTPPEIQNLISRSKVAAGSQVDLARVGVAVWVRPGAPKPDISTVDNFKRMLIQAKSISYTKESNTGVYMAGLIERLGMTDIMKAKTKLLGGGGQNIRAAAAGEVEYGISILSDGIREPSVELLGLLPEEIQNWTVFASGIAVDADQPAPAREFIQFLETPESTVVMKTYGLEPLPR